MKANPYSMFRALCSLFLFVALFIPASSVQAMPEVIADFREQVIPLDRKEPFFMYFSYGNLARTQITKDSYLRVTISSPGVAFATTNLFEIIPENTSNLSCSDSTKGKELSITPSLLNGAEFVYGPGSATNEQFSSGAGTADLPARKTGCVKIGFRLTAQAKDGEFVTIKSDQGQLRAGNLTPTDDLPIKLTKLALGTKKTCQPGQEPLGATCVALCTQGEYRNATDQCVEKTIQCNNGFETVGELCKPVCPPGQERDSFGDCVQKTSQNSLLVSIVVYVLFFILLTVACVIIARKVIQLIKS